MSREDVWNIVIFTQWKFPGLIALGFVAMAIVGGIEPEGRLLLLVSGGLLLVCTAVGIEIGKRFVTLVRFRVASWVAGAVPGIVTALTTLLSMKGDDANWKPLMIFGGVMFGINAFCVASKFSHLSDKDLSVIDKNPGKLNHPWW